MQGFKACFERWFQDYWMHSQALIRNPLLWLMLICLKSWLIKPNSSQTKNGIKITLGHLLLVLFLQKKNSFMRKNAHHRRHHRPLPFLLFLQNFIYTWNDFSSSSSRCFPSNNSTNPHHTIIKKKTFFRRILFLLHESFDFFPGFNSNGKKNIIEKNFYF